MVFRELTMVEGLQRSNVKNFGTIDNYGNSVRIDSPLSAYPSSSTAYLEGQTSSPSPGVLQVWYPCVPVSIVTVTGHAP